MRSKFDKRKMFTAFIIGALIVGVAMVAISGVLSTKQQLFRNACQWIESTSNGAQVRIVDSRDYNSYFFILGTYNNQGAYLSSYKKLPGIPLYTRHIIATNQYNDLTGIGLDLHGKHIELLISPPYTDILIRSESGVLCPAPDTMYPQ